MQVFSALAQGQLQQAAVGSGQAALDTADESLTNWANAATAQLVVAAAGSPIQKAQAAEFFYFGGETARAEQAASEALAAAPADQADALQQRLDAAEKQGAQLNQQIEAYRKQLAKATQGAPGADPTAEPLGDLGGGALGGGGGAASAAAAWRPLAAARGSIPRSYTAPPGPLAQLVEQETLNLKVAGSIPARPTPLVHGRSLYYGLMRTRRVPEVITLAGADTSPGRGLLP